MVARLSLSYVPSLCLSSALSHCLCAVRVLCHIGLAACNKSSFVLVKNPDSLESRRACGPLRYLWICDWTPFRVWTAAAAEIELTKQRRSLMMMRMENLTTAWTSAAEPGLVLNRFLMTTRAVSTPAPHVLYDQLSHAVVDTVDDVAAAAAAAADYAMSGLSKA